MNDLEVFLPPQIQDKGPIRPHSRHSTRYRFAVTRKNILFTALKNS